MPLHPFVTVMLEKMARRPGLTESTPQAGRAAMAAGRRALGTGPEMSQVEDLAVPTRSGTIPARLFVPCQEPAGLVVYVHGGGWVLGTLDDFDALCRTIAAASGCSVLAPDYRLAPEHPFPAGLEDVEDALQWAGSLAAAAKAAPLPLVVAGDSAGANLATIAARRLLGRVDLVLQVLLYPVTDCDMDRASYRMHGTGLPLTKRDMTWYFAHYAAESLWQLPDIAPLRADSLAGLPATILSLAEYDVLHDEGAAYAQALRKAGVAVTVRVLEGLTHGFVLLHNLCDPVRAEVSRIGEDIARACASGKGLQASSQTTWGSTASGPDRGAGG